MNTEGLSQSCIPQIGEFIDTLRSLLRDNIAVVTDIGTYQAVIDGNIIYYSLQPLVKHRIIEEFHNRDGFEKVLYFRLTPAGRDFAEKAHAAWKKLPLRQRLLLRLCR